MGIPRLNTGFLILLPILIVLYAFFMFLNIPLAADALSALCALAPAVALLYTARHMSGFFRHRVPLILFSAGCFTWSVGDVAWIFLSLNGANPAEDQTLWVLYFLTNVFFCVAFLFICFTHFSKWNFVQLFTDLAAILLVSALFGWIVILRRDWNSLARMFALDFTGTASLFLDGILIIGVFQWFATARSGQIHSSVIVLALSVNLYAAVDIVYYYCLLWNMPYQSNVIDLLYSLSLIGIGFGAILIMRSGAEAPQLSNIGNNRRWFMLFIYPLITVILGFARMEGVVVWPVDIVTYLIVILLHIGFSRYIQLAKENERLLAIEKAANQQLEQRVAQQIEAITRLACLDELTGLSNRKHFLDMLEDKFNRMPLRDTLAVIVMNMDRFKTINDHFGTEAADAMLVELADRLRTWVGADSLVARMGGDEYGLLLSGNRTESDLTAYCDDLTRLFNRPVSVAGNPLEVTVSIGAALRTADLLDGRQLLQNAEIALHQAKSQGYNHRQLFDPLMANASLSEGRVELLLRQANIEQDFELFYQPQFSLPDRRLVGAEALCRWHHSQLGFIAPGIFIPVAEKIGFIGKLGAWVLQEAARQASDWAARRVTPIRVGVNISPVQLNNEAFADDLTAIAKAAGASPALLDLEITESLMLHDTERFRHELSRLKELGFSLSIDDFGSGYASVAYLNKYPLNRMKIDKSLIDGLLVRGGTGFAIVKSIIGMAQSLGIETIAEGVERDEQLGQLKALGCNQVQGFLTGRPVPAGEFERLFLYL